MKCQIYNCDKEVQGNYPCCSWEHQNYLSIIKRGLDDLFNADEWIKSDAKAEFDARLANPVDEVIYYSQLIKQHE